MKLKLLTLVFLSLISLGVQAAGKSAFIDPKILLEQSPQARSALETLKNEFKDRELQLRELVNEINAKEKDYQNDSAIMSEDQKKKVEEEIIQRKRKFQFDQQALREDLQKRRNQLLLEVRKAVSVVIRDYGIKNGYDFIFSDGVAFAADSVNITTEILKELEK